MYARAGREMDSVADQLVAAVLLPARNPAEPVMILARTRLNARHRSSTTRRGGHDRDQKLRC